MIGEGKINIDGIDFVIHQTAEAFDVEIPEINAVYTHMLGHDCHSIVAGAGHADAIIAQLHDYIAKGYALILTSHYTPEDLKDAQTKIDYLETLKGIAETCSNAADFKAEVQRRKLSGYNRRIFLRLITFKKYFTQGLFRKTSSPCSCRGL